ncbi:MULTISPECIES: lytic transglycosylase F [unclassified Vibrio]|uniref:transglycosylase SLT domain-containing protein n=1 Tax=unclassified Vibrio TaxID=2614977 RepID=UPI001360CB69|nr:MULTISPECIES: lytic transglycosylase F [unclassified Vibrio]NAW58941.1 transporter substrate-binding domain-containing protein [Vibrio sp. V36_P2S2PM302]NAX25174.1 transporter substrate-binding domain-containing protein [Vibrio sp. V38_P2S17PM301]NAX32416.1 transporter substrate-binding domain-containing protein [Vibrio sp. V37_P2S8PM304]
MREIIALLLCCLSLNGFSLELSPLRQLPYTGDLDIMRQKGVIRVLVSADLGFYYVEAGQPKGIIAELLSHFETQLKQHHKGLRVQVIPVPRDDLLSSLEQGLGDIAAANITITNSRADHLDFTDPLLSDVRELLVTNAAQPDITHVKQLSGLEVWVRASSSYAESLQRVNHQLTTANLEPLRIQFVDEVLEDYDLLEMLEQGHIGMTVMDEHKTQIWLDVMPHIRVHRQLPLRENGQIAWALRQHSPKLKQELNTFINTARSGTLLGNVIFGKYLDSTRWLDKALNPAAIQKLDTLTTLFQRYAKQYQFDYLMMSAQGFQESGLDQSKVSSQGAVGIMQVLPTTAREPYVNIPDIYKTENNIHAGIKYMRFIKDRYFNDDAISYDNKVYFALAAYNAGPANIRRMRELAVKHGYNPNVWFRHVELMARRNIGSQPVVYVSNVNRYYVVYKQLSKIRREREATAAKIDQKTAQ